MEKGKVRTFSLEDAKFGQKYCKKGDMRVKMKDVEETRTFWRNLGPKVFRREEKREFIGEYVVMESKGKKYD